MNLNLKAAQSAMCDLKIALYRKHLTCISVDTAVNPCRISVAFSPPQFTALPIDDIRLPAQGDLNDTKN